MHVRGKSSQEDPWRLAWEEHTSFVSFLINMFSSPSSDTRKAFKKSIAKVASQYNRQKFWMTIRKSKEEAQRTRPSLLAHSPHPSEIALLQHATTPSPHCVLVPVATFNELFGTFEKSHKWQVTASLMDQICTATQKINDALHKNQQAAATIVDRGTHVKLCTLLNEHSWPRCQIAAAEVLSNLACSGQAEAVANTNAVPSMVPMLQHPNIKLRCRVQWVLANLAGADAKYRDALLQIPEVANGL
jgi:hypothetical protein